MDLKVLKHDVVHRGKVFDLIVDQIEYPSGNRGIREVAHHPGGSVAVPLFADGKVLLVRQFRYPFGLYTLEVPAGKLNPGEDPELAAVRELEEETGYLAGRMEKLTAIYTTPGFCDEVLHIYLATGLTLSPAGHRREEGEQTMTLEILTLDEAIAMIDRMQIVDSKTIVGLMMTHRRLSGKSGASGQRQDSHGVGSST
jgi:ADP-ribose pyrophosphatase